MYVRSNAVRATRPDQPGRRQLTAMPAGEYLAIAHDYMEIDPWQDPEYLESLRRYASRLTIPEGGSQTLTLRLAAPER